MAVNQRHNSAVGQSEPFVNVFPFPISALRDPTVMDRAEIGTLWINTASNDAFVLTSIVANSSNWSTIGGGGGVFNAINLNPGPFMQAGLGAHTVNITGAISLDSTVASHFTTTGAGVDLTLSSVGGSVDITGSEASNMAVHIEATDAAGDVFIEAGGVIHLRTNTLAGVIDPNAYTVTAAGAAATANTFMAAVTLTGLATGSGLVELITITCSEVAATSGIICQVANLGANDAKMAVTRIVPGAGSFIVTLVNNGTQALNGNVILSFWVIS